jgi:hypothetical protein
MFESNRMNFGGSCCRIIAHMISGPPNDSSAGTQEIAKNETVARRQWKRHVQLARRKNKNLNTVNFPVYRP